VKMTATSPDRGGKGCKNPIHPKVLGAGGCYVSVPRYR
jgi:hypothetical protein